MPRSGQLQAGETLEQFAERMGIPLEELLSLNPDLTTDGLVEGLTLVLPAMTRRLETTTPQRVLETTTPQRVLETTTAQAPAQETAPTGELGEGGVRGLFEEMIKDFTEAFQAYVSAPSFIRGPETAFAATRPTPGFSRQEAAFLHGMEPELRQRFSEQAMRQLAEAGETGEIPTLTAGEFLRGINVREEMEMAPPGTVRGGRRYGPPSISPRRLRF